MARKTELIYYFLKVFLHCELVYLIVLYFNNALLLPHQLYTYLKEQFSLYSKYPRLSEKPEP
jgi:hypothetical protein